MLTGFFSACRHDGSIPRHSFFYWFLLLVGAAVPLNADEPVAKQVDYQRDVLPILKQRCYECHDGGKQESDLRLDLRESVRRGGASGEPALVAGKSAESVLIARITSLDENERMPPSGEPLSGEAISVLRAWIDQGAVWPDELAGAVQDPRDHWAYKSPQRPAVPQVGRAEWVSHPIDAFILAKLEQQGLKPSPEADRVTLVRRLYLDLVGLPPSPEEVEAFVLDQRPNAYSELVERLLKSPHYGERWGRLWLDAARYADSDGYEKDKVRQVWAYRDWVINAFNRDLPYNQFVIEQLAGDLLPNATQDQRVATGFLRNSMINEEGGIDPEQFRMTAMFDRMDALGKSVLGLTIQCAQCHNHKYDPLTQKEYYQLFAFLNNDHESNIVVYSPDDQMRRASVMERIDAIEADLMHRHPDWQERMAEWEASVRQDESHWQVLDLTVDEDSTGGQKYLRQADGSFLAQGYAPTYHSVLMTAKLPETKITGFRLELLTDPNLPCAGPGRSIWGTGALSEFIVETPSADGKEPQKVKWAEATADFNPPVAPLDKVFDDRSGTERTTGPIAFAIDGKDETAWCTDAGPGRRNQPRVAVFRPEQPVQNPDGQTLRIRLAQYHGGWNSDDNQSHNLGRVRLSYTTVANPRASGVPARLLPILDLPRDQRSPEQQRQLFSHWRTQVAEWKAENDQIEALWKEHPVGSTQLVLTARDDLRTTHYLHRGDFLQPRDPVAAEVPTIFHPLPETTPRNRLAFAQWLVDPKSPTVARAFVNRVWQAYFGLGLVETPEDLGMRGAPPSHPELLDWMAVELIESGYSIKQLHRLIVHSSTYRQSSAVTPLAREIDPQNRWFGRASRFRLDAELVRDSALAVSGLLNRQAGGPSVHPPLPAFLVEPPASYGPKPWPEDQDADRYRRAVYTFRFRSVPYPPLEVFDAPNGDFACVKRSRSNTPLQALTTLNEPLFIECADALARRMEAEGGATIEQRVAYGFQLCVARSPQMTELQTLIELFQQQTERAKANQIEQQAAEKAALRSVARVLLNLDETITRE